MKEELTIKEIKEAKAELERNLAKMIDDFERKYGIEVSSIGWDCFDYDNPNIRTISASVELNLKI